MLGRMTLEALFYNPSQIVFHAIIEEAKLESFSFYFVHFLWEFIQMII